MDATKRVGKRCDGELRSKERQEREKGRAGVEETQECAKSDTPQNSSRSWRRERENMRHEHGILIAVTQPTDRPMHCHPQSPDEAPAIANAVCSRRKAA